MIIDAHTHIFPDQVINNREAFIDIEPAFNELYKNPKSKMSAAEDIIRDMDRCGIDKSIVLNFSWQSAGICVDTNNYIIESVNKYKDKFIGFGMILLDNLDFSIYEINRCADSGLKGIGEIKPSLDMLSNLNKIKPIVDELIKRNMVLLIHTSEPVGHQYPGKGSLTPEVIYRFIISFPELKMICAHWGGGLPFYTLMPEVRQAINNVYFDTAASPFLYNPEIYRLMNYLSIEDKIIFGSDYPLMSPSRLIKEIDGLKLDKRYQNKLFEKNIRQLLDI
jgi:uncharacterized protein